MHESIWDWTDAKKQILSALDYSKAWLAVLRSSFEFSLYLLEAEWHDQDDTLERFFFSGNSEQERSVGVVNLVMGEKRSLKQFRHEIKDMQIEDWVIPGDEAYNAKDSAREMNGTAPSKEWIQL